MDRITSLFMYVKDFVFAVLGAGQYPEMDNNGQPVTMETSEELQQEISLSDSYRTSGFEREEQGTVSPTYSHALSASPTYSRVVSASPSTYSHAVSASPTYNRVVSASSTYSNAVSASPTYSQVVSASSTYSNAVSASPTYSQVVSASPTYSQVVSASIQSQASQSRQDRQQVSLQVFELPEGVSKKDVIGEDHDNIKNINRVLSEDKGLSADDLVIDDKGREMQVIIRLEKESDARFLFSKLIDGLKEREMASTFNKQRLEYKQKSQNEYSTENFTKSETFSRTKAAKAQKMNESNENASEALFNFYNYKRHENEIDLHGQLVADESQLDDYRKQLFNKNNAQKVDEKIEDARKQMDEALRHLEKFDITKPHGNYYWNEIIVGAGNHSRSNKQKIRPKVEEFIRKKGLQFKECNKGSLLIEYAEYKGEQPCLANFYCKECYKVWESNCSWKDFYQKCYRCDKNGKTSKCFPLKMRKSPNSAPRRRSNDGDGFSREDHKRLCQKCIQMKRYCRQ